MATQEQLDDLATKASALGAAKRAWDDALRDVNRANDVTAAATNLITALETRGAGSEALEPILVLQLDWLAEAQTAATTFNSANLALTTAQGDYDTALATARS